MSRRYADPVEVRRRDEEPAEFLWRGRLYVVRDVLAHWVEAGAWWRSPAARAVYAADPPDAADAADVADTAAPIPDSTFDDGEREVWRVEAGAGRMSGTGVFDLCFDWSAGSWTLARTLD